jgi:hypothetical protein
LLRLNPGTPKGLAVEHRFEHVNSRPVVDAGDESLLDSVVQHEAQTVDLSRGLVAVHDSFVAPGPDLLASLPQVDLYILFTHNHPLNDSTISRLSPKVRSSHRLRVFCASEVFRCLKDAGW